MLELLEEIIASKKVGYRTVDPNRGGWEDMGIEKALQQRSLLLRFKTTLNFISESVELGTLRGSQILDAGEYNPFSKWLQDKYNISVQNTPPDLDFDYLHLNENDLGKFDFVFSFETLEHLMNPLIFLVFLNNSLKDNGKVFLSTPFSRPRFLWSKYHITEYFPDKIEILANKAGFRVLRYKVKKVYDYRSALMGIRPIFRALWFERIMFFEFEKY